MVTQVWLQQLYLWGSPYLREKSHVHEPCLLNTMRHWIIVASGSLLQHQYLWPSHLFVLSGRADKRD